MVWLRLCDVLINMSYIKQIILLADLSLVNNGLTTAQAAMILTQNGKIIDITVKMNAVSDHI